MDKLKALEFVALSDLSDGEALVRLKAVAVRRGLWFKILDVFA